MKILRDLADQALARLVPHVKADACLCAPDCHFVCYHHAKLWCCTNCACDEFCSQQAYC